MKNLFGAMALMIAALGLIGCEAPAKLTGGGQIVDELDFYPSEQAAFGFNGDSCEGTIKGHFNFVDQSHPGVEGGVKMNGEVADAYECLSPLGCGPCFEGELVLEAAYDSTNPFAVGSGSLTACLQDNGEGNGATDNGYVAVSSGPFAGYSLEGAVSGNVQQHDCKD